MKGTILNFNNETNEITISGDDNNRYRSNLSQWRENTPPQATERVDFEINEGRAVEVFRIDSGPHQKISVNSKNQLPIISLGGYILVIILYYSSDIVTIHGLGSYTAANLANGVRLYGEVILRENSSAQAYLGWCILSIITSTILVLMKSKHLRIGSLILSSILLMFLLSLLSIRDDDGRPLDFSPSVAFLLPAIILIGQIIYGVVLGKKARSM
jgi:uncharacterized integral membrane protein